MQLEDTLDWSTFDLGLSTFYSWTNKGVFRAAEGAWAHLQVCDVLVDVQRRCDAAVWNVLEVVRTRLAVHAVHAGDGNRLVPPRHVSAQETETHADLLSHRIHRLLNTTDPWSDPSCFFCLDWSGGRLFTFL